MKPLFSRVRGRRRGLALGAAAGLALMVSGPGAEGATFTVSSIGDSGPGTLRDALTSANAGVNGLGPDLIQFAIAGSGVHTIQLLSPLPAITDPVVIDGGSQTGYAGSPLIELNGASAGVAANGLYVQTSNCVVRGLAINRFALAGIRMENARSNVLMGNYVGTSAQGTTSLPNGDVGVYVLHGAGNRIGGTNASERNVISGNLHSGIYIFECDSSGNTIQGNFIGTTASGSVGLGNRTNGVVIDSAPGNVVGGTMPGARNVVSGNGQSGIFIYGACASGNVVAGNYIGTDWSGSAAISNTVDGVTVFGASNNTVGGTDAAAGNLISGNGQRGVTIAGPNATGNVLAGNYIGTDASGRATLGNNLSGVTLTSASGNEVGGQAAGGRNVISGNRQSGLVVATNCSANRLEGNYVGVDATGTNALGNLFNGVLIQDGSGNTVGGTGASGRNIISGNGQNGIVVGGVATSNVVQGNFVGTDAGGSVAVRNARVGVWVESGRNVIGSGGAVPCNVISGNGQEGILLVNAGAGGNLVQGNYIGTDATGTKRLGNLGAGVGVSDAPGNTIGGAQSGLGNVISGNGDAGIYLVGRGASGNQALGNRIGTDATGTSGLGNSLEGIYIQDASTNVIGGTGAAAGNLISGNATRGIYMTNTSWDTIQGNMVGTKADGAGNLGNVFHAVELEVGANNNVIGTGNRIAFSQTVYAGVRIRDGATNNFIHGNAIFGNGALGIDLGTVGVTLNDNCDSDTGANMLQNFPVLSAVYSGAGTVVRGSLNSGPNRAYLLQFYASAACDASGNGEGQTFLGEAYVTTSGNCGTNFSVALPASLTGGQVVTATATDPNNNTSEFSACATVPPPPTLSASGPASGMLTLGWPSNSSSTSFMLQQTESLKQPVRWTTLTNLPALNAGRLTVTVAGTNGSRFYRLAMPALAVGGVENSRLTLAWPATPAGLTLQQTDGLKAPVAWTGTTNVPALSQGRQTVSVTATNGQRFYRLVMP